MNNCDTAAWCYREAGEYDINDEFPPSKAELRRMVDRAARRFRELGAMHRAAWEASREEARVLSEPAPRCQAKRPNWGDQCELPEGHDGAHRGGPPRWEMVQTRRSP